MSQSFIEGFRIPTTKVVAGPCVVTQIRQNKQNGKWSVQLGFGDKKIKHVTKALQGHLKGVIKENIAPRYLKEISLNEEPNYKVGDTIKASDIFRLGDVVSVAGTSKGKGFAGGVKRWGFHGGPKTHGQSDRHRAPGSIGQTTTPGRVLKGKHMAGRMGNENVIIKNLHIISINPDSGEIEISGAIPGIPGGVVFVNKISSGSLKELEHETVAQVVEGEAPAEGAPESGEKAAEAKEEPKGENNG